MQRSAVLAGARLLRYLLQAAASCFFAQDDHEENRGKHGEDHPDSRTPGGKQETYRIRSYDASDPSEGCGRAGAARLSNRVDRLLFVMLAHSEDRLTRLAAAAQPQQPGVTLCFP
jgi:hypothetical protein